MLLDFLVREEQASCHPARPPPGLLPLAKNRSRIRRTILLFGRGPNVRGRRQRVVPLSRSII